MLPSQTVIKIATIMSVLTAVFQENPGQPVATMALFQERNAWNNNCKAFYRLDGISVTQPTESKHGRKQS